MNGEHIAQEEMWLSPPSRSGQQSSPANDNPAQSSLGPGMELPSDSCWCRRATRNPTAAHPGFRVLPPVRLYLLVVAMSGGAAVGALEVHERYFLVSTDRPHDETCTTTVFTGVRARFVPGVTQ